MTPTGDNGDPLTPNERKWLAAVRATDGLEELVELTGAGSEHEAYFQAKRRWRALRGKELDDAHADGIPGESVDVDGRRFHVHGITHAGTAPEREFLRQEVGRLLAAGAAVYCEQGIRRLYFEDVPEVCAMDDYSWAMEQCRQLDDSRIERFDGVGERVDDVLSEFREAAFSLIDSGGDLYGEQFRTALGDVVSSLLTDHGDLATGEGFESFNLSRAAAENPNRLVELQRYYARAFLPQPIEREWLRRHDPELETVTHGRNERMADYAVYQADANAVHLIIGAAHQPGVVYYLERHRDGERNLNGFEPVG